MGKGAKMQITSNKMVFIYYIPSIRVRMIRNFFQCFSCLKNGNIVIFFISDLLICHVTDHALIHIWRLRLRDTDEIEWIHFLYIYISQSPCNVTVKTEKIIRFCGTKSEKWMNLDLLTTSWWAFENFLFRFFFARKK